MTGADRFAVGAPLPRLASASVHDGFRVTVTWQGDARAPGAETVDLAPALFRYDAYAPLRDDPGLFGSVHVTADGFALAWGEGAIDMTSTTLEALAARSGDRAPAAPDDGTGLLAAQEAILRDLAARFDADDPMDRVTDYLAKRGG